jgi:hypothetical protein
MEYKQDVPGNRYRGNGGIRAVFTKNKRLSKQLTCAAILLASAFAVKTCWSAYSNEFNPLNGEYKSRLCGSYYLTRMNGFEVNISGGKRILSVRGNIARYAVKDPYITGFSVSDWLPTEYQPIEGFFLIDTSKDELKQGMTESDWNSELKRIDWSKAWLVSPPRGLFDIWRL